MEIRTASQAIDALGGTAKVARMFATKLSRQAVSNWRLATRGLPPDTFYVLGPALRRKRHVFTPLLFGQKLPATRAPNGHSK